jgi:hypothetical protein
MPDTVRRSSGWSLANTRARRLYERAGWHADGAEKRDTRLGFEIHEVRYARGLESV